MAHDTLKYGIEKRLAAVPLKCARCDPIVTGLALQRSGCAVAGIRGALVCQLTVSVCSIPGE